MQGKYCPEALQANGSTDSPALVALPLYTEKRQVGSRRGLQEGQETPKDKDESRKLFGYDRSRDNRIRKRNKENF